MSTTTGSFALTLLDAREPTAGPDEVVIRVRCCALNFPDVLMLEDKYQIKPVRPFAPGGDVAGEIAAVGSHASNWRVGERVAVRLYYGGLTETLAVPADKCVRIPRDIPWDAAAALLTTYGTSYYALKQRGRLLAGETVIVLGASGGVGSAAIQIAKAMGARVIAAASSDGKVNFAISQGADAGVVYPLKNLTPADQKALSGRLKEACGARGADVIYDPVGGDYTEPALRALAWNGRHLVIGFTAGIPRVPLNLPLLKGTQIVGVIYGTFADRDPAADRENLREIYRLYQEGQIKPSIASRYSIGDASLGIEDLRMRRVQGKVVITL